jgi:hypothetical protein
MRTNPVMLLELNGRWHARATLQSLTDASALRETAAERDENCAQESSPFARPAFVADC